MRQHAIIPYSAMLRWLDTHYILTDDNHVMAVTPSIASEWRTNNWERMIVEQTICAASLCWVSTTFTGMNLQLNPLADKRPVLFETMIFGGALTGVQVRYHSWEQAKLCHEFIVGRVEAIPLWRHAWANVRRDLQNWFEAMREEFTWRQLRNS